MRGNLDAVMLLKSAGVDVDSSNEHGDTPFLIASWEGHVDIVKFLFKHGGHASANRQNADGDTPLAVACWEGHVDVVRFLVAVRVDMYLENMEVR